MRKYNIINILIIVIMVIIGMIAVQIIQNSPIEEIKSEKQDNISDVPEKEKKETSDSISNTITKIMVNPPISYSDKTKEEIFEIRKNYVRNSIFKNIEYSPSEYALGQIESKKPWLSTNICKVNGQSDIDGTSEESRFLNNPSVLVAFDFPYIFSQVFDESECNDYRNNLMPISIEYSENERLITVSFQDLYFETPKNQSYVYQLKAINAVDFGYKYAYIDKTKSNFDNYLYFTEKNNISNQITELKDFIHLGTSCQIEGGCNNGSPNQPMLQFKLFPYEDRPIEDSIIYIKLWKDYPKDINTPCDMIEKIIIIPDVE